MYDSILITIKKMLGIAKEDTAFDTDITVLINSALMELNQIGVGTEECFIVESDRDSWSDFLNDSENFEAVKTYIYLKAKLIFDPPSTSFGTEAVKDQINRLEWRLNVQAESMA